MKDEWGCCGGWGPKTTVINSGATQKSSLQRFASFLHKDGERKKHFLINLLLVFAPPDTDCGESVFFTAYDTRNGAGRRKGAEQVEGLELSRTGI